MTWFHIFHDKNSAFKPLTRIWGLMPPFTSRLAIAWTVLSCKVYCDRNAKKHIFGVIRFITGQASGNCWTWKRRIGDAASDCHRCGFSANEAPCCSQLSSPLAMWKTYTLTLTRKWCRSQCTNVLRGCRIFKACNILQCLDCPLDFFHLFIHAFAASTAKWRRPRATWHRTDGIDIPRKTQKGNWGATLLMEDLWRI